MSNLPSIPNIITVGDENQDPADSWLLPDDAMAGLPDDDMPCDDDKEHDPFLSDAEADADALASCGMGTDEDYGCYGGGEGD